jgi:hypothetical protein
MAPPGRGLVYCTEHPGCEVQASVASEEQSVGAPLQLVAPAVQEQPDSPWQVVSVVLELQAVTVPEQGAFQAQPVSF